MRRCVALAMLAGCGTDPAPTTTPHALGMNDVTILLPLPADATQPVLTGIFDQAVPLVEPAWFDAMVFTRRDLGSKGGEYFTANSFHVVAVRIDLCDRQALGPCPAGADGRLRLVAQPIVGEPNGVHALDIGIHLFYPIPAAELAGVIAELRALAELQDAPDGPLAVSTGASDPAYLAKLRALVLRYADWHHLVRFTANGQHDGSVGNSWLFRELDQTADGTSYDQIVIPNAQAIQQNALLQGGDVSYVSSEVTDVPAGLLAAIAGSTFAQLDGAGKAGAVDAIAAMENPTLHDAFDSQCLGCHVGTYIGAYRAGELAIDPATSPSWYHNAKHDLTVAPTNARRVRGLGYFDTEVVISQRVANDTANVLDEIETRFP
jgi:hypothetical protein